MPHLLHSCGWTPTRVVEWDMTSLELAKKFVLVYPMEMVLFSMLILTTGWKVSRRSGTRLWQCFKFRVLQASILRNRLLRTFPAHFVTSKLNNARVPNAEWYTWAPVKQLAVSMTKPKANDPCRNSVFNEQRCLRFRRLVTLDVEVIAEKYCTTWTRVWNSSWAARLHRPPARSNSQWCSWFPLWIV